MVEESVAVGSWTKLSVPKSTPQNQVVFPTLYLLRAIGHPFADNRNYFVKSTVSYFPCTMTICITKGEVWCSTHLHLPHSIILFDICGYENLHASLRISHRLSKIKCPQNSEPKTHGLGWTRETIDYQERKKNKFNSYIGDLIS